MSGICQSISTNATGVLASTAKACLPVWATIER